MEAHGVKHHYHHHPQSNSVPNHHNSLTNGQPTFNFGSTVHGGTSQISFETTAFPLLLSSIESGRQNFNSAFSTRAKNTLGSVNNAAGNAVHSNSANHLSSSSTFQQFSLPGKQRQESASQGNNLDGLKAIPKSKSVATPNLITNGGRPQATYGQSTVANTTNGHHSHQSKSSSNLTTSEPAALAVSSVSHLKKNHAREPPSNSNVIDNRNRASPNKENKTAPQPSPPSATVQPVSAAFTKKTVLARSSGTAGGGGAKQQVSSSSAKEAASHGHHDGGDHVRGAASTGINTTAASNSTLFGTGIDLSSNSSACRTSPSSSKPKEFKFFKAKAKDKQYINDDKAFKLPSPVGSFKSKASSDINTAVIDRKSIKRVKSPNKAIKVGGKVGRPTKPGKPGPKGPRKKNGNKSSFSLEKCKRNNSTATDRDVSSATAVNATKNPEDKVDTDHDDSNTPARVILFTEYLMDGFTFQCFTDVDSLECSLLDAYRCNIPVIGLAQNQSTPPSDNKLTSSSSKSAKIACAATAAAQTVPSPLRFPRVVFRHRSPSTTSTSDVTNIRLNFLSSSAGQQPQQSTAATNRSSRKKSPRKEPIVKKAAASQVDKQAAVTVVSQPMTKESKSKKGKLKKVKMVNTEIDGAVDDSEKEPLNSATVNSTKCKCDQGAKMVKNARRNPKSKATCKKCMLSNKKAPNKKKVGQQTKVAPLVGRKSKCKDVKERPTKSVTKGGGGGNVVGKGGRKSQQKPMTVTDEEDSSNSDLSDEEQESDQLSENESDATLTEDEQEENDECEDIVEDKRTIFDLIKCSNRREAVRKAAERAALSSVNSRNKTNRTAPSPSIDSVPSNQVPPVASHDAVETELSGGKKTKLKKMPGKNKSSGVACKAKARRPMGGNKRSHSDLSSSEVDDSSEDECNETDSIANSLRGSNATKKMAKSTKVKKPKIDNTAETEVDSVSESDQFEEEEPKSKGKSKKKSAPLKVNKVKNKGNSTKVAGKRGRPRVFPTENLDNEYDEQQEKDPDSDSVDEKEEAELCQTDLDDERDDEDDSSHEEKDISKRESCKKSDTGRTNRSTEMKQKRLAKTKKLDKASSDKVKLTNRAKVRKNTKKCEKVNVISNKNSGGNHSGDETEQSEDDSVKPSKDGPVQSDTAAIVKSKCDRPKGKATKEDRAAVVLQKSTNPVKDVYTFELSPTEAPSATARLVLSSGQENKCRTDGTKAESSQGISLSVDRPTSIETTEVSSPNQHPVKSQTQASVPEYLGNLAYEPLRPDSFANYEPKFGANESLSSLSQLSQSIGGEGSGPILLNHHSASANNKCPTIKEELRDEQRISSLNSKQSGDRFPTSQQSSTHSGTTGHTHPKRIWSNASAGSFISSSSSSPSQVPLSGLGQPPVTTSVSLSNYFTPSISMSGLSPSLYPPQNQEMLRRELDSRLLASTVGDGSLPLASSTLGAPTSTSFNHATSSPLVPTTPSSTSSLNAALLSAPLPNHPLYPNANSYLHGLTSPMKPILPLGNSNQIPINEKSSHSTTIQPQLTKMRKGSWATMHFQIAKDIYCKQQKQKTIENRNAQASSNASSRNSVQQSKLYKPSTSGLRSDEPSNQSNVSKPSGNKNSFETLNSHQPSTVRPSSATTFTASYPPRYGTPLGAPSLSAPPMFSTLFPPTIHSPIHLPVPGFMPETWSRTPVPVSLPTPVSSTRPQYMLPEYYSSVNSASSTLSSWAAGIRSASESLAATGKTNIENGGNIYNSGSSQKRKSDKMDVNVKERVSSKHGSSSVTSHYNGETLSEQCHNNKHNSPSKHIKGDKGDSHYHSRTTINNGDRARPRDDSRGGGSSSSSSKSKSESRHELRQPSNAGTDTPNVEVNFASSLYANSPSPYFGREPTRYDIPTPLPPPAPLTTPSNNASNPFGLDLVSRSVWPFNMPSPVTSNSSVLSSSMGTPPSIMPDPFKSLQDISLRPGLVTPDRETLFSRYSLLNSSGGGASIFEKFGKEQLDRLDMMHGQGKVNQAVTDGNKQSHDNSFSHGGLVAHRLPASSISSSVPPPPPPPSSTPFSYSSSYLNALHPFGSPGSHYLPHATTQMSHPPYGPSSSSPMLNGTDSLSKAIVQHSSSVPIPPPPAASFMLPPHYPPPPSPSTTMMNFLKVGPSAASFHSAR